MGEPADFTTILKTLRAHDVDLIVVGGISAVLNGAPISTFDVDIVPHRTPANIDRLLSALAVLNAHYRGHPGKKIRPTAEPLAGPGHQLLMTDAGPLDVLGALGEATFESLIGDTTRFDIDDISGLHILTLERLIQLKEATGREKDRAMLPVLRRTLAETKNSDR